MSVNCSNTYEVLSTVLLVLGALKGLFSFLYFFDKKVNVMLQVSETSKITDRYTWGRIREGNI